MGSQCKSVMALAVMAAILAASPVFAVQPDEILKDAGLESRARALSAELRCLVCQNQSIDDSDAPLAKDLRVLVRERLQAGDTDQAVLDYIVARYGDFVLLKPPVNSHTLLLWIAPLFVLAGAVLIARRSLNGPVPAPASTAGLSASEEAELKRILADAPDSSGPRGT